MAQKYVGARTVTEELLVGIWEGVLGLERVGVEDNFFELGGDSIMCLQIVARGRGVGLQISVEQMFRHQTIARLAGTVERIKEEEVWEEEKPAEGEVPLTPIQRWFFEQEVSEAWHWNQSVLLRVPVEVQVEEVESGLRRLLRYHDALRMRFRKREGMWEQEYGVWGAVGEIVERIDLSGIPRAEQRAALEREGSRLQASLDLEAGRLLRAGWFDLGGGEKRLLLVIHHLVVDGVSWRILLEDLQIFSREQGGEVKRSSSFQQWAKALVEYAGMGKLEDEIRYWEELASCGAPRLRREKSGGENTVDSTGLIKVGLNAEESQALLQEVPRNYRVRIQEVLTTALVRSISRWNGGRGLLIDLEGHGREELPKKLDVSRTVGWFTTLHPVYVQLDMRGLGEDLKAVKEQLRRVPGRGLGYGVLRYLDERQRLRDLPQAEVVFNYLGQFDQLLGDGNWRLAEEGAGVERSGLGRRPYLLEINSYIGNRCLQIDWSYSKAVHREETMQMLAAEYVNEIRELIAYCRTAEGGQTPSDFPLAKISQSQLDQILLRKKNAKNQSKQDGSTIPSLVAKDDRK